MVNRTDVDGTVPPIYSKDIYTKVIAHDDRRILFFKSHDQNESFPCGDGMPLIPDVAIYLVRHPLDVFVSMLNYLSDSCTGDGRRWFALPARSVEDVVARGHMDYYLDAFIVFGTLLGGQRNRFGSWFENVGYWTGEASGNMRVITIRYEQLVENPALALKPVSRFLDVSDARVAACLEWGEQATRPDNTQYCNNFYWMKTPGNYRRWLTPSQIDRFASVHGEQVSAFGYGL